MKTCLFCGSDGPYSTVEHIIPESLGNDDLLLRDSVCDKCQSYFGSEIEKYVLDKTDLAFWRVFLGIKTKGRKNPSIDMSQPKKETGWFPKVHPAHDNIGFTAHDDGFISIEVNEDSAVLGLLDGSRNEVRLVMTPHLLFMLGRFLCKIGLELTCSTDSAWARSDTFDLARNYARYGAFKDKLWPLFNFDEGKIDQFRRLIATEDGACEEVDCYHYSLISCGSYVLFHFGMGTSNWVVCLNDPYPSPVITEAFSGRELKLVWYPDIR